jgi:hypothetical protein
MSSIHRNWEATPFKLITQLVGRHLSCMKRSWDSAFYQPTISLFRVCPINSVLFNQVCLSRPELKVALTGRRLGISVEREENFPILPSYKCIYLNGQSASGNALHLVLPIWLNHLQHSKVPTIEAALSRYFISISRATSVL